MYIIVYYFCRTKLWARSLQRIITCMSYLCESFCWCNIRAKGIYIYGRYCTTDRNGWKTHGVKIDIFIVCARSTISVYSRKIAESIYTGNCYVVEHMTQNMAEEVNMPQNHQNGFGETPGEERQEEEIEEEIPIEEEENVEELVENASNGNDLCSHLTW